MNFSKIGVSVFICSGALIASGVCYMSAGEVLCCHDYDIPCSIKAGEQEYKWPCTQDADHPQGGVSVGTVRTRNAQDTLPGKRETTATSAGTCKRIPSTCGSAANECIVQSEVTINCVSVVISGPGCP